MPEPTRLIQASAARGGDDPIFALHAEAMARRAQGEDVLNSTLGALMNDDGTLAILPSVYEAIRQVPPDLAAAYAPISGPQRFLDAVVEDLFESAEWRGAAVAAATPGGTGACHHAIVNFLEPGQKLLTSNYFWGPYRIIAEHTRRGLATFPMFAADGSFGTEALEREMSALMKSQGRVLLVLNSPCHNPTGYSLDDEDWGRLTEVLLSVAKKGPVAILFDFAYAKFARPESLRWHKHLGQLFGHVTILFAWTASKAFAQYGSRVGACVALEPDPEERTRIKNALGYSCRGTWSNCNHLGMLAVAELLVDPALRARSEAERAELIGLLHRRVEAFNDAAGSEGLSYPRYEGGFFVAVFTPDPACTADSMKADGVFVVPLSGAVRIAVCSTPQRDVARLVTALAKGVRKAGG